jgi:DNA polymerase-3 subunit epsilon
MLLEDILEERDLVVIDLETTGTNVQTDRIVQFAAVRVFADHRPRRWITGLIDPTVPIPAGATEVHGITDEMVRGMPTFAECARHIVELMNGADIAGYNVLGYDIPLLVEELKRCGLGFDTTGVRVIDGLRLFMHFERRDLSSALRFYCGREHSGAHGAIEDVRATIQVIEAQLERYRDSTPEPIPTDTAGLAALCMGNRVTLDGKVVWQGGRPCLSFGKHSGVPLDVLARDHRRYVEWMLDADFSADVKRILQGALAGEVPTRGDGT